MEAPDALATIGQNLGLLTFSLVTLGLIAYLLYSMLRPDRF